MNNRLSAQMIVGTVPHRFLDERYIACVPIDPAAVSEWSYEKQLGVLRLGDN